ncbi:unnamed protein product [Tuber melanosporum]|uniref:(Perigord truffle) hypothetical protein n=1 Tax=Tuber melanosporum (strain Mel28) TaxID=656061 RepID=D5GI61_TUBMM|nr:uncharacterized protein GSTUM_00008301001 [Tuber melanosporum]CAZ84204.1 unnamed protein product [Tuber melanosporum]
MYFIGGAVVPCHFHTLDENPLSLYFLPHCFRNGGAMGAKLWVQDRLLMADILVELRGIAVVLKWNAARVWGHE